MGNHSGIRPTVYGRRLDDNKVHHYLCHSGNHLGVNSWSGAVSAGTSWYLEAHPVFFVQWPVRIYISAIRGTPLFVQIMVVHFALVPLFINPRDGILVTNGIMSSDFARMLRSDYGAFLSCIVAITLNAGAYVSEIFRAGIQSIDRGQMEASRSLGMSYGKTMRKVILPQAFRRMLPPLGNNAIAIVKDSSLASAIGLADLAYAARTVSGAYATYWEPYLVISVVYWVITFLLSLLVRHMETRFGKSDSRT